MTSVEQTIPAMADEGRRLLEVVTEDERLQIQVLFQEDISLAGDEPLLQVTGNIPSNQKLGMAFLHLANRLLNTVGSRLP